METTIEVPIFLLLKLKRSLESSIPYFADIEVHLKENGKRMGLNDTSCHWSRLERQNNPLPSQNQAILYDLAGSLVP